MRVLKYTSDANARVEAVKVGNEIGMKIVDGGIPTDYIKKQLGDLSTSEKECSVYWTNYSECKEIIMYDKRNPDELFIKLIFVGDRQVDVVVNDIPNERMDRILQQIVVACDFRKFA